MALPNLRLTAGEMVNVTGIGEVPFSPLATVRASYIESITMRDGVTLPRFMAIARAYYLDGGKARSVGGLV